MGADPLSATSGSNELVGRARERAGLDRWLDAGESVVVHGPPGVGCTALIESATAGRPVALAVRGHATLQPVPYVPLRLARAHLVVAGDASAVAARLATTVPATGLVVVDDLQWCDADTVAVVRELSLLRQVVAASHDWPLADAGDEPDGFTRTLALAPLDDEAATALVDARRPAAPRSDRRAWVEQGGGLPARLVALAEGRAPGPDGDAAELHDLPAALADDDGVRALRLAAAGDRIGAAAAARAAAERAPTVWSRAGFLRLEVQQADPPPAERVALAVRALAGAGRYREALELHDGVGAPTGAEADREADPAVEVAVARAAWATSDLARARAAVDRGLACAGLTGDQEAELLTVRSRLAAQVDWDQRRALADAERAAERAGPGSAAQIGALSALGTAHLLLGDPRWRDDLEVAGRAAVAAEDLHGAVVVHDVLLFAHLFAGDPARCAPLAAEMIELTEPASRAWNGYFRAAALLARVYVDPDHRAVTAELERLDAKRLTVKSRQLLRHAQVLTTLDAGDELDAIDLAARAAAEADDDAAVAAALYLTAEACWLAGEPARALAAVEAGQGLPSTGSPRDTTAALIGLWASADLGRPAPEGTFERTGSRFANLRGARLEAEALLAPTPAAAVAAFDLAGEAWAGANVRARLRCRWAAADRARLAGDTAAATSRLRALEDDLVDHPVAWLRRRVEADLRRLGLRSRDRSARTTGEEVVARVARGQSSAAIARSLVVAVPTVETHVRAAVRATGARNRVQAAATLVARAQADRGPSLIAQRQPGGGLVLRSTGACRPGGAELDLGDLPTLPWRLDGGPVVRGRVDDDAALTRVVLAAARGAELEVEVPPGARSRADQLVDALTRLGHHVRLEGPRPASEGDAALDHDARRLLDLLAEGATLDEAARALGYSRRTVQRRLEAVRRHLGVATNREAVIAARPTTTTT